MSKINKILFLILIIIGFYIGVTIIRKDSKKSFVSNSKNVTTQTDKTFASEKNEGGNVTVTIKPKILKVGEQPTFEVAFSTHSVDLNFDISQISSLIDDKGDVLTMPKWDGTGPGGHHRSGTLAFNPTLSETKYVELIIKDVAGVAERKYKWNL